MTHSTLSYDLIFGCLAFAAVNLSPLNIMFPSYYRCLRNLSLVSKQVSIHAQKALFRSVYLMKSHNVVAFGKAIDPGTEKGLWLAGLVNTLTAGVHIGLTQKLFTAALLACPNVHELNVDIQATTLFDMSSFRLDCISRSPPIQTLRIGAAAEVSAGFLCMFPSLKFVEFKKPCILHSLHGISPACKLVELRWPGPVDYTLIWVLQNSVGTITILVLPSLHPFDIDLTEDLMRTHGPSLRSLHIPSLLNSEMAFLRHCTQLKELIVDGILSEAALIHLPATIEHLQVQLLLDFEPQLWSHVPDFLARFACWIESAPSLRRFTWVHDDFSTPGLDLEQLRKVCNDRGTVWRDLRPSCGMYLRQRDPAYVD